MVGTPRINITKYRKSMGYPYYQVILSRPWYTRTSISLLFEGIGEQTRRFVVIIPDQTKRESWSTAFAQRR